MEANTRMVACKDRCSMLRCNYVTVTWKTNLRGIEFEKSNVVCWLTWQLDLAYVVVVIAVQLHE